MPILLYWFDQSIITMESWNSFEEYDEDAAFGALPKSTRNKLLWKEPLTKEEQLVVDSLRIMEQAKENGLPFTTSKSDYELFALVPVDSIQSNDDDNNINNNLPKQTTRKRGKEMPKQGDRVEIWWDGDEEYYEGIVHEVRESFYDIHYDDSETEWLPLAECDFKILSGSKPDSVECDNVVHPPNKAKPNQPARVDLGTKVCQACKLGQANKQAHDYTCPKSKSYQAWDGKVDSKTPRCRTCATGSHRAHDVTCPKSQNYQKEETTDSVSDEESTTNDSIETDENDEPFEALVKVWKAAVSRRDATTARDSMLQFHKFVTRATEIDPVLAGSYDLKTVLMATQRLLKSNHDLSFPSAEIHSLERLLDADETAEF